MPQLRGWKLVVFVSSVWVIGVSLLSAQLPQCHVMYMLFDVVIEGTLRRYSSNADSEVFEVGNNLQRSFCTFPALQKKCRNVICHVTMARLLQLGTKESYSQIL